MLIIKMLLVAFAKLNHIFSLKQNAMNTNKLLIGALLGGVAYFLLGWVLYGMLFMDTIASMMPGMAAVQRSDADMDMVAMIIGNLSFGLLLAYIFEKWAGIRSFIGGLVAGATVGFLLAFGYDCILHGTTTMCSWNGVILDSVIFAVISGLAGGLIGWWLGYNQK
ncbi:MAG: hypothetical protein IPM82_13920 [Saprospiraceae bacterium]|nr:hypothetical protein [Saprospiraceae bacterium]